MDEVNLLWYMIWKYSGGCGMPYVRGGRDPIGQVQAPDAVMSDTHLGWTSSNSPVFNCKENMQPGKQIKLY